MGVFQMSLINQMLQDLDARNSDGAGTTTIHSQIRAVPTRSVIHVARWCALVVLMIVLGAVISWLWLRKPAPAAMPPALKQAMLSSTVQPAAQQHTTTVNNSPVVSAAIVEPTATIVQQAETKAVIDNPSKEPVQAREPKASAAGASATINNMVSAAPAAPIKSVAPAPAVPAKKSGPEEPRAASETALPVHINKQVKELTQLQRAENEYRKATSLMQQGRTAEAMTGLEQALQLDPLNASARQTLVGLLLQNKRQDEAVRKLQEGLNLDPSQVGMAMILTRLQVDKGELRSAMETMQRTLPYTADRDDYQAFLAALLQRQERHKEAIEHYLIALRKTPHNGVWWMGLGISLQAENRLAEAHEAFSRAKTSNSLSAELQVFVAQKLNQLQR
jgi:MSHA biogenesis protein MshN